MLRRRFKKLDPIVAITVTLVIAAIIALVFVLSADPAGAATGGVTADPDRKDAKPRKAKLRKGRAIPPRNAPRRVKKAIRAANKIRRKPYKYGGGHGRWNDSGYDCSGAVSYVLRAAGALKRPLDSGGLSRWGRRGKGKWITVYAHGGHAYAMIAGLRWDTSMVPGDGPGWSKRKRSANGFKRRHRRNL